MVFSGSSSSKDHFMFCVPIRYSIQMTIIFVLKQNSDEIFDYQDGCERKFVHMDFQPPNSFGVCHQNTKPSAAKKSKFEFETFCLIFSHRIIFQNSKSDLKNSRSLGYSIRFSVSRHLCWAFERGQKPTKEGSAKFSNFGSEIKILFWNLKSNSGSEIRTLIPLESDLET